MPERPIPDVRSATLGEELRPWLGSDAALDALVRMADKHPKGTAAVVRIFSGADGALRVALDVAGKSEEAIVGAAAELARAPSSKKKDKP